MGQFQYAPQGLCALPSIEEYGCMTYTYCWGGVNSTTIQCVHEQSITEIFPVFYMLPMDHLQCMYKSLTKTKNTQSLKQTKQ